MNRSTGPSLAIIVALTDPSPDLDATLDRFAGEAGSCGEVLILDASGTVEAADLAGRFANVRVIARPRGRLAPSLWRDGLLATDADLVAITTAQMTPGPGWIAALTDRLRETGASGVGGPIEPGSPLGPTDRAVALLRYANYFGPLPDSSRIDPPGDNALYLRARLMAVESTWRDGFWEVEVHQGLRRLGDSLAMADRAVVTFLGGGGLISMARQRFRHARRYATGRSAGLSVPARISRILGSPLVPPLLGWRIVRALRGRGMALAPWISSVPSLAILATIWAIGEAVGTWPPSRRQEILTPLISEVA